MFNPIYVRINKVETKEKVSWNYYKGTIINKYLIPIRGNYYLPLHIAVLNWPVTMGHKTTVMNMILKRYLTFSKEYEHTIDDITFINKACSNWVAFNKKLLNKLDSEEDQIVYNTFHTSNTLAELKYWLNEVLNTITQHTPTKKVEFTVHKFNLCFMFPHSTHEGYMVKSLNSQYVYLSKLGEYEELLVKDNYSKEVTTLYHNKTLENIKDITGKEFLHYLEELLNNGNTLFKKYSIVPTKGVAYSNNYKGFLMLPIYDNFPIFRIPRGKVKSISAIQKEGLPYTPVMYLDNFRIIQVLWPHILKEFIKP